MQLTERFTGMTGKGIISGAVKYGLVFFLGFGTCCWNQGRELDKARDAQQAAMDSVAVLEVALANQQAISDSLDQLANTLRDATVETDHVRLAAAAQAWRAKERARIKDAVTVVILDSLNQEREVVVPAEVVTRIATLDTALTACTADANLKGAALEACGKARAQKDAIITTMTGIDQLKDQVIGEQQEQIAILESKKGIDLGLFRLHLLPKVTLGYGAVYNVNCRDDTYRVTVTQTEAVKTGGGVIETVDETRVPITYPPGYYDLVDGRYPGFDYPKETVERTTTIDRTVTTDHTINILKNEQRSNGCQRFVHGPGAQATLLTLKF